jgi:hypothetical protein
MPYLSTIVPSLPSCIFSTIMFIALLFITLHVRYSVCSKTHASLRYLSYSSHSIIIFEMLSYNYFIRFFEIIYPIQVIFNQIQFYLAVSELQLP